MKPQKKFAHAIVIGAGIAGLLAARVLLNHFEKVTIIERDTYPQEPVFRPGVPQGRQAHVLLLRGQRQLEAFFPGLQQKLLAQGAVLHDYGNETLYYYGGGGSTHRIAPVLQGWHCSRLLIEWQIRQELTKYDQLQIIEGHEVCGCLFHQDTIIGVQYRARNHRLNNPIQDLHADLVIDASGSSSRVPGWLQELGYKAPGETEIHTFLGYATRLYQRSASPDWKSIAVHALESKRGGALMKMEGDRWMAVLAGSQRDYPPTDEASYLEFARSLPDQALYEFLKQATPLSKIYGYRRPTNCIRHFERLTRLPEHFLVVGDAVCSFNPIYGQGMTVAALEAQLLDRCLSTWRGQKGFSRRFQRKMARVFASPWQLGLIADSDSHQSGSLIQKCSSWYMGKVIALLPHDPNVFLTFLQVIHMLRPPSALLHPATILKVLASQFSPKKAKNAEDPILIKNH